MHCHNELSSRCLIYSCITCSDKAAAVVNEEEYNARNKRHFSFEKNYHKQNSSNEEFRYQGTINPVLQSVPIFRSNLILPPIFNLKN